MISCYYRIPGDEPWLRKSLEGGYGNTEAVVVFSNEPYEQVFDEHIIVVDDKPPDVILRETWPMMEQFLTDDRQVVLLNTDEIVVSWPALRRGLKEIDSQWVSLKRHFMWDDRNYLVTTLPPKESVRATKWKPNVSFGSQSFLLDDFRPSLAFANYPPVTEVLAFRWSAAQARARFPGLMRDQRTEEWTGGGL